MSKSYASLWAEIDQCEACKNDDRIDPKIRDWWKQGVFFPLRGVGPEPCGLPVRYLLVAQEPSAAWAKGKMDVARKKVRDGFKNFNVTRGDFVIRWAAHNWLVNKAEEAFFITDLAKCTVAGKDARKTMERRYPNCHPFLHREVEAFLPTLRGIVPIGKEAYRWCIAAAGPSWPRITTVRVTHYAYRFLRSQPKGADNEGLLTETEFAEFAEFVKQHNPALSARLGQHERAGLARYKKQFTAVKAELSR